MDKNKVDQIDFVSENIDAFVISVRAPYTSPFEQVTRDVFASFLKLSDDLQENIKGFFGERNDGTAIAVWGPDGSARGAPYQQNRGGAFGSFSTSGGQILDNGITSNLQTFIITLIEIAKQKGIVKGPLDARLVRFDVQRRRVLQQPAVPNRLAWYQNNGHRDTMQAIPEQFYRPVKDLVDKNFKVPENRNEKGIAFICYLRADESWSGTELCIMGDKLITGQYESIVLRPTVGDIVGINETVSHGVCNAENLKGATKDNEDRVMFRVTMPYSN